MACLSMKMGSNSIRFEFGLLSVCLLKQICKQTNNHRHHQQYQLHISAWLTTIWSKPIGICKSLIKNFSIFYWDFKKILDPVCVCQLLCTFSRIICIWCHLSSPKMLTDFEDGILIWRFYLRCLRVEEIFSWFLVFYWIQTYRIVFVFIFRLCIATGSFRNL